MFSSNFRRLLDSRFAGNASDAARAMGVNPSLISRWSRGLSFPDTDVQLDKIAKAFGVPISSLFLDPGDLPGMDLDTALDIVVKAIRDSQKT